MSRLPLTTVMTSRKVTRSQRWKPRKRRLAMTAGKAATVSTASARCISKQSKQREQGKIEWGFRGRRQEEDSIHKEFVV